MIIADKYKAPKIAPKAHHLPWEIYPAPYQIGDCPVAYGVIIPITPKLPASKILKGISCSGVISLTAIAKNIGINAVVCAVVLAKK